MQTRLQLQPLGTILPHPCLIVGTAEALHSLLAKRRVSGQSDAGLWQRVLWPVRGLPQPARYSPNRHSVSPAFST